MSFTIMSILVAIMIRIPALYVGLSREGYWEVDAPTLIFLAIFAAFLGFIMPAQGIDLIGTFFRIVLFTIILMVLVRMDFTDALGTVIFAAIIEAIIIVALMISPFNSLVAGMSPLMVP